MFEKILTKFKKAINKKQIAKKNLINLFGNTEKSNDKNKNSKDNIKNKDNVKNNSNKQFEKYYKDNEFKKYYIIVISASIVILLSLIVSVLIIVNHKDVVRIAEEKVEHFNRIKDAIFLEETRDKEKKLNKQKKEDEKLKLTVASQKERNNFKYNKNAHKDIEKLFLSNKKEVYLTFDDGPSRITNQVLDVLKAADVKATFFILGTNIKGREDDLRRIYNEGHTVGNHGFSHVYSKMYKTPQATLKEYNQTEKEFKKVLGKDFNSGFFRFPGGSYGGTYAKGKKNSQKLLLENNIAFVDWNVVTDDSVGAETTKEQLKVFNQTRKNHKTLIVLQHDSYYKLKLPGTLKLMIEQLKKEGYVFKNFNDILVKEVQPVIKEEKNNIESKESESNDIENNKKNENTSIRQSVWNMS